MNQDIIIPAIDVQTPDRLNFIIEELACEASMVKVGMELYYSFGEKILDNLSEKELKIFLDLKLHDIPNTVGKSCKALGKLGIQMLNVHAAGGADMMSAANESFKSENEKAKLIAVTQLTSTSQKMLNEQLLIPGTILDCVLRYAELAKKSGLDGVVCSAMEAPYIKKELGPDFLCITPGIRPSGADHNDQKRVMTPQQAMANGSDYLVIGRAITEATSPKKAFQDITQSLSQGI
ncbi:MAG: orotidine-5'-phosphate decarboxylase [Bacteriovoracaceae bacterium]|jgi:orotidine-5'-phosphate decarboxylase|nr:orotidine-5'-phosphate decarboxylase [Bacteriovoracaceae bacterium]